MEDSVRWIGTCRLRLRKRDDRATSLNVVTRQSFLLCLSAFEAFDWSLPDWRSSEERLFACYRIMAIGDGKICLFAEKLGFDGDCVIENDLHVCFGLVFGFAVWAQRLQASHSVCLEQVGFKFLWWHRADGMLDWLVPLWLELFNLLKFTPRLHDENLFWIRIRFHFVRALLIRFLTVLLAQILRKSLAPLTRILNRRKKRLLATPEISLLRAVLFS